MAFKALSPEHQKEIMAKGRLSTARDPTGVLISRMVKVTGHKVKAAGEGSFGPAQGRRGGGKGGMRTGPYGGGGGGMGNQQEQLAALLMGAMGNQGGAQSSQLGMGLIEMGMQMMMNQEGNKW